MAKKKKKNKLSDKEVADLKLNQRQIDAMSKWIKDPDTNSDELKNFNRDLPKMIKGQKEDIAKAEGRKPQSEKLKPLVGEAAVQKRRQAEEDQRLDDSVVYFPPGHRLAGQLTTHGITKFKAMADDALDEQLEKSTRIFEETGIEAGERQDVLFRRGVVTEGERRQTERKKLNK